MNYSYHKMAPYVVGLFVMIVMLFWIAVQPVKAADQYDDLREKWKVMLTGGTAYNPLDPDIGSQLSQITSNAQTRWDAMDKSVNRTCIWTDICSTAISARLKDNYTRIKEMALAYSSKGSTLENNSALLADITSALDWMYANRYNENKTRYDNWWHWDIGVPLELNDIMVLLYDQLSSTQISNYMRAIDHFQPSIAMSGANRVWECTIIGVSGILVKDSTKIANARDGLSLVLNYVTSSDGFYTDGSFIQHEKHPYTGGYGISLLSDIANMVYVLEGSAWTVTDANKPNIYRWVYNSYEALIYKGAMMDMTRGREISRMQSQDHVIGHTAIQSIIRIAQFAPAADAAAFKSMVKYWIAADTYRNFFTYAPINMIILGKGIMNDSGVIARAELIKHQQFPNMDRAVHLRPGFGFGISMYSSRIYNYESINTENPLGYYMAEGMTYLYNQDLAQYSDDFWPTVNKYRLPGTTVDTQTRIDATGGQLSSENQVGGTSILNLYGVSSMSLKGWNSNLSAKKSWFMFDDEVVALGAGITDSSQTGNGWDGTAKKVETTIENRKLNSSGSNTLTVNGTAKSTALGWSETITGAGWMHLAGNTAASDIGYYFPGGATVKGLREARTSNWRTLNSSGTTTNVTRNYMTLWFDHGTNPTDQTYSYVLLPGKTSAQVSSYASNPGITILENSTTAQAVKETTLNVVGVNFWTDALKWIQVGGSNFVSSNKKASVMTSETSDGIEVAVSDTTQANAGTISIEINKAAAGTITRDSGITVTQLSPTIKFNVNVNSAKGKTFKVKFSFTETGDGGDGDEIIIDNTSAEFTGTWVLSSTNPNGYNNDYHTNASSGTGADKMRWRPNIPAARNYTVYYYLPDGASNRASNAPITINYNGGSQTFLINERPVPGGQWIQLGTTAFNFAAGTSGYVELTDNANGSWVIGDAIKFVPVPNIIVNNTSAEFVGTWVLSSTNPHGLYNDYHYNASAGTGADTMRWRPDIPLAGNYKLYYYLPDGANNRASNAPFTVYYNGGSQTFLVNERPVPGGQWIQLGTTAFNFASGTSGYVELTDNANNTWVIGDAIKWVME